MLVTPNATYYTDLANSQHSPEELLETNDGQTVAVVQRPELQNERINVPIYGTHGGYRTTLRLSENRTIALINKLTTALVELQSSKQGG